MRGPGCGTRLVLDRTTVACLAAGLVMLQVLIFSAGFLVGAAKGVQALTPPDPPLPLRPRLPAGEGGVRIASLMGFVTQAGSLSPQPSPALMRGRGGIAVKPSAAIDVGAGLALAREGVNPSPASRKAGAPKTESRPSPLAKAAFLLPPPPVKLRATPVRKAPRLPRTAEAYAVLIREAAERHSVSPALVEAVARVESGFNPRALSHKGARGLMQVIPATGRRFGVRADKLFDPEHNIAAGTAYLAWLSKRYGGNLDFVLAAYNAGEGAVDDHGGIPPYRETRDYVRRVKTALRSIEEEALSVGEEAVTSPRELVEEPLREGLAEVP